MQPIATCAGAMLLGLSLTASNAHAQTPQPSSDPPRIVRPDAGTWMPAPDIFPPGAEMQVLNGDPATGPADFYFKVPANYAFPWHFHTPIERLMVDDGTLQYETRGGDTSTVAAGMYVYVPARSPHRVTCTASAGSTCRFFLASSGPFDIHLLDDTWNTIRSWRPEAATSTNRRR